MSFMKKYKAFAYKFLDTDSKNYSALILRVALWIYIFAHGGQKLFGLFGWNGFDATMSFFTLKMWIPYILALLVIIWEWLGSIALILGFKTRFMAFSMVLILIWAIAMVHFKNWFYDYEAQFLWLIVAFSLMITWGWALSLDSVMKKWFKTKK